MCVYRLPLLHVENVHIAAGQFMRLPSCVTVSVSKFVCAIQRFLDGMMTLRMYRDVYALKWFLPASASPPSHAHPEPLTILHANRGPIFRIDGCDAMVCVNSAFIPTYTQESLNAQNYYLSIYSYNHLIETVQRSRVAYITHYMSPISQPTSPPISPISPTMSPISHPTSLPICHPSHPLRHHPSHPTISHPICHPLSHPIFASPHDRPAALTPRTRAL